jgi:hypothetical protein
MRISDKLYNSLSDSDKKILHKACQLDYTDWSDCFALMKEAESPDLIEAIRNIMEELYHKEESYADCL